VRLVSANGKTALSMLWSGVVVLLNLDTGAQLWTPGPDWFLRLDMQPDGNLVGSGSGSGRNWSSGTAGSLGAKLLLRDDGDLEIVDNSGIQRWHTNTAWYKAPQLMPGQRLTTGQQLQSTNGKAQLTLQPDGNLVLKRVDTGTVLWASGTQGKGMTQVVMQADGNLVGSDAATGTVYFFNTFTFGFPGAKLVVGDDGNLVILDAQGVQRWGSNTAGFTPPTPRLIPGQQLATGQQLVSANWKARLTLQSDGNLVLKSVDTGAVLWASGTQGKPITRVLLQGDGNVEGYNDTGVAYWSTQTAGHPDAILALRDDGNLVVISTNWPQTIYWATNTRVP
jgi:hypothetical protein